LLLICEVQLLSVRSLCAVHALVSVRHDYVRSRTSQPQPQQSVIIIIARSRPMAVEFGVFMHRWRTA